MIGQLLKIQLRSLHCHHHAAALAAATHFSAELQPLLRYVGTLMSSTQVETPSYLLPLSLECSSSLARPIIHMMATAYTSPVYTYQFKITNSTPKEQTYIIKPPNMPSPVPLPADRVFPALYTCTLAPSASQTFTTEIPSSSQGTFPPSNIASNSPIPLCLYASVIVVN
jgi:hypothetical protein